MPAPVELSFIELEPILEVSSIEESLDYYTNILGFDVNFTYKPDDQPNFLTHAGLSFGNRGSHNEDGDSAIHTHLQIMLTKDKINKCELFFRLGKEIYDLYEVYKQKDVKIVKPLEKMPWGIYEFYLEELNGHVLRFTYSEEHFE